MLHKNDMILGKGIYYSLDCFETQLNNNVMVVGASGSGKTRSIVIPNILQATGSYVVTDPKGNLYEKYGPYLREHGYAVRKLDFTDPEHSGHYNPFAYLHSEMDILKLARMMAGRECMSDPFWDKTAEGLLAAYIAYLREFRPQEEQNLEHVMEMIRHSNIDENDSSEKSAVDLMFDSACRNNPQSFAVRQYKNVRVAAGRTYKSILVTLTSKFGNLDGEAINEMMMDDGIDITSIGREKTALFVIVSDTDRSMDMLANIFYSQAMNVLCEYADKHCKDNALPVPVRFILDDFATNVVINEFPRMIASFRSRNISCMLMIQAESQLEACFGSNGQTIIGNCDTYVYLGGNDVDTARAVAERCDCRLPKVLNMPVKTNWIFRRGQEPIHGENFDLEEFLKSKHVNDKTR